MQPLVQFPESFIMLKNYPILFEKVFAAVDQNNVFVFVEIA